MTNELKIILDFQQEIYEQYLETVEAFGRSDSYANILFAKYNTIVELIKLIKIQK